MEEQRFNEELDLSRKKHRLERMRKERRRDFLRKELPVVESAATAVTGGSFRSSSLSVAPSINEESLTLSREQSPPGQGKNLVEC